MKKKFISFESFLSGRQTDKLANWFDRLTFIRILLLWLLIVSLFGFIFHFFSSNSAYLFSTITKQPINSLLESIYFSFISATTTGFGDIVPTGNFKIIATIEVIFGLLLLAVVTSKLVSIKQNVIIGELYEISFNEKINKIRSALLLFRQTMSRLIARIDDNTIRKKEVKDIYIEISSLDNILSELETFVSRQKLSNSYMKQLDPVSAELLLHSINLSFLKLNELIEDLVSSHKHEWKRPVTTNIIKVCMASYENIFAKIKSMKHLSNIKFLDLESERNEIFKRIKENL